MIFVLFSIKSKHYSSMNLQGCVIRFFVNLQKFRSEKKNQNITNGSVGSAQQPFQFKKLKSQKIISQNPKHILALALFWVTENVKN